MSGGERGRSVWGALFLGVGLAACSGTPDSVRALSAAQLKNEQSYCADVARAVATLKGYFERYRDEKLAAFDKRHAQNKADAEALVRAKSQSEKWDAAKTAAEMASQISSLEMQNTKDKADLDARVGELDRGLDALTTRCEKLVRSESKLNDYAQTKKAEEAVNEVLSENLGLDTKAMNQQIDSLVKQVSDLEKKAP
jgi:hypothetical protein